MIILNKLPLVILVDLNFSFKDIFFYSLIFSESEVKRNSTVVLNLHKLITFIIWKVNKVEVEWDFTIISHFLTSTKLNIRIIILIQLNSWEVWESLIGNICLLDAEVLEILSPGLPFFLSSNNTRGINGFQVAELKGRGIWKSLVSNIRLLDTVVLKILSPFLPLFFSSTRTSGILLNKVISNCTLKLFL